MARLIRLFLKYADTTYPCARHTGALRCYAGFPNSHLQIERRGATAMVENNPLKTPRPQSQPAERATSLMKITADYVFV